MNLNPKYAHMAGRGTDPAPQESATAVLQTCGAYQDPPVMSQYPRITRPWVSVDFFFPGVGGTMRTWSAHKVLLTLPTSF